MDDSDFKKKLNPEQYRVMREKDTERPFSGKYWDTEESGLYSCAACGSPLFLSLQKFDAGLGWPCFRAPLRKAALELGIPDAKGKREALCKKCGGHLGYVVPSGDERNAYYQVNSAALSFHAMPEIDLPEGDEDAEGKDKKSTAEQWADKVGSLVSQFSPSALISSGIALLIGAAVAATSTAALCKAPTTAPTITTPVQTSVQTSVMPPTTSTSSPAKPKATVPVPPKPATPATTSTPTSANSSTSTASSADGMAGIP